MGKTVKKGPRVKTWGALCDSQVPRRCHCETHTLPFFFADTHDDDDDDDNDDDDDYDDDASVRLTHSHILRI